MGLNVPTSLKVKSYFKQMHQAEPNDLILLSDF